jgi:hypothetical protein
VQSFLEALEPIWRPHDGQREFLLHPAQFKALACGRRWGKTDACAAQIVASLHGFSPRPGAAAATKHIVLAPTQDQANLLFDRVVELLRELEERAGKRKTEVKIRRSPYPRLTFRGHRVTARSGHLGRSLRGNEATHLILDEAAYLPEQLITEVAMPMLATTDGCLTLISTPRGLNHFWRFFRMGQRGEHGIWSRHAPSWDSPLVSKSFLAIQEELISERAFRVEYGAEFVDSEGRVFRQEAIEQALTADLGEPAGDVFIGIDWGRYQDFTAVAVLQGNQDQATLIEIERFHRVGWLAQVERVAEILRRYPNALVTPDASGAGDPILTMLRDACPNVNAKEFVFTAQSKGPLIERLAGMFERNALAMRPYPPLLRELEHFEATTAESGHRRLEGSSGYHDDLVIALALAAVHLPRPYRQPIRVGAPRRFAQRISSTFPRTTFRKSCESSRNENRNLNPS